LVPENKNRRERENLRNKEMEELEEQAVRPETKTINYYPLSGPHTQSLPLNGEEIERKKEWRR
jgi:hypothetical protein